MTLPTEIGHPHEARLHDVAAQHNIRSESLRGITSAAEWFPLMSHSERRRKADHGRQPIRADERPIRCVSG